MDGASGLEGPTPFIAELVLPDGQGVVEVHLPSKWTVDQVKAHCFRTVPQLQTLYKGDYVIGLSETDVLSVEFVRFARAHRDIEQALTNNGKVHIQILPRYVKIAASALSDGDLARRRKSKVFAERSGSFASEEIAGPSALAAASKTPPPLVDKGYAINSSIESLENHAAIEVIQPGNNVPKVSIIVNPDERPADGLQSDDMDAERLATPRSPPRAVRSPRPVSMAPEHGAGTSSSNNGTLSVSKSNESIVSVSEDPGSSNFPSRRNTIYIGDPNRSYFRDPELNKSANREMEDVWVTTGKVSSAMEKFRKLTEGDSFVPSPVRNTIFDTTLKQTSSVLSTPVHTTAADAERKKSTDAITPGSVAVSNNEFVTMLTDDVSTAATDDKNATKNQFSLPALLPTGPAVTQPLPSPKAQLHRTRTLEKRRASSDLRASLPNGSQESLHSKLTSSSPPPADTVDGAVDTTLHQSTSLDEEHDAANQPQQQTLSIDDQSTMQYRDSLEITHSKMTFAVTNETPTDGTSIASIVTENASVDAEGIAVSSPNKSIPATVSASGKKIHPSMSRLANNEDLAMKAMNRTSLILDSVLQDVVIRPLTIPSLPRLSSGAPHSPLASASSPAADKTMTHTDPSFDEIDEQMHRQFSRRSVRHSRSLSHHDAENVSAEMRRMSESDPNVVAYSAHTKDVSVSSNLTTSESFGSVENMNGNSEQPDEEAIMARARTQSESHARTTSEDTTAGTPKDDLANSMSRGSLKKNKSFNIGAMLGATRRKDSSASDLKLDAIGSDEKSSLASRVRSTIGPFLSKKEKGRKMNYAVQPLTIPSPRARSDVGSPPTSGVPRSISEPDNMSTTSSNGDRPESIPTESPIVLVDSDAKPLGSRPLAHLRQPIPVAHAPEELAFSLPNISACKGWVVEKPIMDQGMADQQRPFLLEPTEATGNTWFRDHFAGHREAKHYIGTSKDLGPFVVSIYLEGKRIKSSIPMYKALLRTQHGDDFVTFPASLVRMSMLRSKPTMRDLLKVIDTRLVDADVTLLDVGDKDLDKFVADMVSMEDRQRVKSYKFGVLYVREGQSKEEDMFGNEHGSPAFDRFLEALGDRVKLLDWKKYRAGLDTTRNTTGTESIYTTHGDYEVMFHVSTLLPYRKNDAQQLERKRHIGNDIGVIVYREGHNDKGPYLPNTIESEFNHVLAVVDSQCDPTNPDDANDRYLISFATKKDVPWFGPPAPRGFVFRRDQQLREFLLTKLINGENACFLAPTFASKIRRTRAALYKNLFDTFAAKL